MDKNYFPPDWNEKSKNERILFVLGIVFAIIVAITIIITLCTNYNLHYIYYPGIFLFLLTQGLQYWKYNKVISITEFLCSIIFLLAEIILIIKG